MKGKRIPAERIAEMFSSGLHCSQVVLAQWADELGYDVEEMYRAAAAFGGGMFRGDTCGAVTGALIAIGLKYGAGGDPAMNQRTIEKVKAFQACFTERLGSTICRELLGFDFSTPDGQEKIANSGKLLSYCPMVVETALDILDKVMDDCSDGES